MSDPFTDAMEALAAAFSGITGLTRYSIPPGSIEIPAVVVSLPGEEFADLSPVMGQDCVDLTLVLNVFVQWTDIKANWAKALPYCSPTGGNSLFAAVMADPTLGGVVDSALPGQWTNFGSYTYGAQQYLGAETTVEVLM